MIGLRLKTLDRFWPGWLAGLASAASVAGVATVVVIGAGLYDTRATTQHSRPVSWAIHLTMIHSVRRRADPVTRMAAPTPETLLEGAREYEAHCVACHGGPGAARARWASAMVPTPPFLLDASVRWNRTELHSIVHDGVKMTGMPAWGEVLTDDQVANIVTFVTAMRRMTPEQFRQLQRAASDSSRAEKRTSAHQ